MAENKCIGCDTPIPSGANKCPMCGAPFTQQSNVQVMPRHPAAAVAQGVTEVHHYHTAQPAQPVLIEQTAKKWKKLYLWAWLFFFLGFTSCIGAAGGEPTMGGFAGFFFLIAVVLYIRARAGAWWNHG